MVSSGQGDILNEEEVDRLFETTKHCPIDTTFRVIGKKFTILIMRNMLMLKRRRFNEFAEIEGINPKTLSARLKEMEKHGLVARKIRAESPLRTEYVPTDRCKALLPILEQMAAFSVQYYPKIVFRDGAPRPFKQVVGRQARGI